MKASRILRTGLLAGMLMLAGCGYHLVGHGGGGSGAIPADVKTVSISGNADASLMSLLRQRLQSEAYAIVEAGSLTDQSHYALIIVKMSPIIFIPSTFDISGVATQYRMTIAGSITLQQHGETVWQSGAIQRQGDVFVTGGPTSIEASRQRLQRDLGKQWLSDAVGRIRSGF